MPDLTPAAQRQGEPSGRTARLLRVRGVVQGVGFRPFVYNLALRCGVNGWVRNTSAGVEIQIEGGAAEVAAFRAALPREAPPRSFIAALDDEPAEGAGSAECSFLESAADPSAYQLVSPDISTCDDCRRELLEPSDRRYRYPFTNCTNCGPRFTIIEELPYDRERTTMRVFPMCPACRREYTDPTDRRFHAEPNACPVCGPQVTLIDVRPGATSGAAVVASGGYEPIARAAELLRSGAIVAVKGLGGFHLACDATDEGAVRRLKERKHRPDKPLAVMFHDIEQVVAHCRPTSAERELLASVEHPIVLIEWRGPGAGFAPGPELTGAAPELEPAVPGPEPAGATPAPEVGAAPRAAGEISPEVAVRQRYLGVMLPYTPLHILLLEAAGRPLVMTSGNLAEEPIVRDIAEIGRLAGIPDYHLVHDRDIAARYDDSVAIVRRERPRLVRRSRGYAPFPLELPRTLPQVLACGTELKNTFCLTRERNAFLSQHIGDLENLETLEHFEASVALYERLFRLTPEVVAYDLHPEYLATKYALARLSAGRDGAPLGAVAQLASEAPLGAVAQWASEAPLEGVAVQHHHAHVAACLAENGHDAAAIGVSMDGLGYGDDGALWGGEVLLCDLERFRRFAHLEYLPLPGGALAIARPVRTAAGWLLSLFGPQGVERARRAGFAVGDAEVAAVSAQVESGLNAPLTSSAGRLFDAVAALGGVRAAVTYEGQAAIELEMISTAGVAPYGFEVAEDAGGRGEPHVVRLAALFDGVLADLEAHAGPDVIGSRLHATVAAIVLDTCRRARRDTGLRTVALSGGVFQNRLLTDLCEDALTSGGFTVLTHARLPANDGGLSFGQAVVAGYTVLRRRGLLDASPDPLEP
jgi:hydrogenase maturation protein HypF